MLNNKRFLKIGSYVGLLSIISSNVAMAIPPKVGELYIHARKELRMVGAPPLHPVVEDINQVSYEDFDVTSGGPQFLKRLGDFVWKSEKRKVRERHLDTNIPYIGGINPKVDYASLRAVPLFMAMHSGRKLHPMDQAGAKTFFEKVIVKNHQNLRSDMQEIPDMDCLYYKDVGGVQHLFLRLSSETRKRAEIFNKESNGKTIYVEQGNARLISDGNATLDHAEIKADNIDVEAENKLLNRASQMEANDTINLKAREQMHETIINKWISEYKEKHKFAHAEGIHSIDYCTFNARKVIQDGCKADNIGIVVKAEEFEDRAVHTTNMPAKVTLHNYAWAEDDSWCSHAEAWVDRLDDYLEPTRYFVKKFLSKSDVKGSSAKFGYTFISADSEIDVLKDIKEDVVVHERHEMRSHEEKSGLSFLGGVKVPDPTLALKRAEQAYRADNMMGFTTSAISAAAKGIRTYQDYKQVQKVMNTPGELNFAQTIELLKVLSHFVNGSSIQIGSRSVDVEQSQNISHGNLFTAPKMVFHNKERSTFAGKFVGDDIDIKTKTFVTFDLPQVFHSKMSMHQSGISVDLLTLALACCGGAGLMAAALTATTVNVSSQDSEQHVEIHKPTIIQAKNKLNIEAETGELTQAQIKAGIVHAIFTKDLSLKSLANIKWSKNSGGGIGFSLGGFANFKSLAESLVETAASSSRSHIDSGSFEKKIDDFASMVGEEEFYLKVGNVLKTESAFIGHILHDPKKEHIEAGKRIDTEVEQQKYSWDNSFDLSIKDLTDTIGAIKQTVFDNAIEEGATTEDAVKEVQKVEKETREFLEKEEVKETVKEIKKINSELKKVEEKQKKLEEETPELKTMVKGLSENNSTIDSEKVDEYKKLQEQKEELTKEGLFVTQFVYELTEDYANKHSWSEEVKESLQQGFGKLCGFVSNVFDKITGEKVEAMGLAKPVAKIALKAGARSKAGKEFIKFLIKELLKQGLSQTKINEIMTEFGVDPVSDKASIESFDEYDDVSTGIFERRVNNDPRQMKFPFGDKNQGGSSGDNNGGTNGDGGEPQGNTKHDIITREKRWQELAATGKLSKEVRETINRTKGKGVYKQHGLELAHKPGRPAKNGHDFREALPKTKSDHRNQHRFYKDNDNDTISVRRVPLPNNKMTGPQPGIFKKLGEIEKEIKGANI